MLITGVSGFAGSHLLELVLAAPGAKVAGVVRAGGRLENIAGKSSEISLFYGDVCDYEFIRRTVEEWRPDLIFHLAGQAAPSLAWQFSEQTLTVNVLGQYNVLKAVAEGSRESKVLVVGSADEYGLVRPDELPVKENNEFRPTNPYAVSKIAQDMLGLQFFLSHGVQAVRVRPFNHIGPRQTEAFVTASFASQIAAIEARKAEPVLRVGNLNTKRDFTDVRDMVKAYWLALTRGQPGEVYNLGSGASYGMGELLDVMLEYSSARIVVQRDEGRFRSSDVPNIICDVTKFSSHTSWRPSIPIHQSVRELLDYWRERTSGIG